MSAITRNEALVQRRRSKRVVLAGEEQLDALPSSQRDPEKQAIDRDSEYLLRGALASLPSTYRTVFQLREMERVSTVEAGKRLGLTGACVKSRLHRARTLVRGSLVEKQKRVYPLWYSAAPPPSHAGVTINP